MLAGPPFSLLQNLSDVDDAIDCNAQIADAILDRGLEAFGLPKKPGNDDTQNWQDSASANDVDKAHSTIRQFYRDWSAEGAREREFCYGFVLRQLRASFLDRPTSTDFTGRPKILVPGAGLGRLVYEICRAGYHVEGNEISYHQLLASSWVLNHAGATPHILYPFATQFTNLRSRKQQLLKVMIPDVNPAQGLKHASANGQASPKMTMTAADFVVLYSGHEYEASFDAVATMFFIDTAPNFLRYVDTVSKCLKANAIWINVGPLLWHSDVAHNKKAHDPHDHPVSTGDPDRDAGIGEPGSVELTEEEVLWLLEKKGFRVEHREISPQGLGYIQDPESMFQNLYQISSWVARKTE